MIKTKDLNSLPDAEVKVKNLDKIFLGDDLRKTRFNWFSCLSFYFREKISS